MLRSLAEVKGALHLHCRSNMCSLSGFSTDLREEHTVVRRGGIVDSHAGTRARQKARIGDRRVVKRIARVINEQGAKYRIKGKAEVRNEPGQ